MPNIWDEFDKSFDTEALAKDIEDAKANGGKGTYTKTPYGTYEISVNKLELTKSKKGDPMVTCWMKVLTGEHKGSTIFMNQLVTQGFQFGIVDDFVESLMQEAAESPDIHFHTYNQYGNMLMDVAEAIDGNFEYLLEYGQNSRGYDTFKIKEVYVLED